jgi:hypothetical protein
MPVNSTGPRRAIRAAPLSPFRRTQTTKQDEEGQLKFAGGGERKAKKGQAVGCVQGGTRSWP